MTFTPSLQVNIHLRPRNAHAMAAVMLCPGVAEVVAFGGCSKLWKGPQDTQAKLSRSASYMFQYGEHIQYNTNTCI